MSLVLTITTGRVERDRAEAFQTTFQTLLSRRFADAPYLRQAMLVHLGDGVWQSLTLWESALALSHTVDNDVPLTVRIFRDFGADPEIRLADVAAFLQPMSAQQRPTGQEQPAKAEESTTGGREAPDDGAA